MLRLLSIRNFVVIEALDLELDRGFTVLTGETGAGKSILLDALALLLGDRFELRQLKPGADRAELAASFDLDGQPHVHAWLAEQGLSDDTVDAEGELLLRRTLDAQGKSRAWINGRAATLAQLKEVGETLVDLHGQHAHQSLLTADAQRALLDEYAKATSLARDVAAAWRAWKSAIDRHEEAARAAASFAAERDALETRRRDLAALAFTLDEWETLEQTHSRLAHAANLIESTEAAEEELAAGDGALTRRVSSLLARLKTAAVHDATLLETIALLESSRIALDESARSLRAYRQRLDVDPRELSRIEQRIAAIHEVARRHRIRVEEIPQLLQQTQSRLAELDQTGDVAALAKRIADAEAHYRHLAAELSAKRKTAAAELSSSVTASMQDLAMEGGRFEIACEAAMAPASFGLEQVEFRVAAHPKQPLAALSRVASGGELSRIALAIQVATSEVGSVPTLIFDEVDAGIGGGVAATVGQLMQGIGLRRQVMCVTHLPQVAAFADAHFSVVKEGDASAVRTGAKRLANAARIEELARMLAGSAITTKARAHARELLEQGKRQ